MDCEIIFPLVDTLPPFMGTKITTLVNIFSSGTKDLMDDHPHLYNVYDQYGEKRALYKTFTDEGASACSEVAAYLLNNGFGKIPACLYIRTNEGRGCLMEYAENHGNITGEENHQSISLAEIQKHAIIDVRYGNLDRHTENTMYKIEGGEWSLILVDHEECFKNIYTSREMWWLNNDHTHSEFSTHIKEYVKNLNADRDIQFLERAGLPITSDFTTSFKIYTTGKFVRRFHKDATFHLQEVVDGSNDRNGEEEFIRDVFRNIEQTLEKFVKEFHGKAALKKYRGAK